MVGGKNTLKKVLVADDSPAIRTLAESALRQAGYDVFTVANGADALEWTKSEQPDLVLVDLSLPGLDGRRVCELLKLDSSLRRIFVLILLNAKGIKRQKELKTSGADGFVVKPFTPEELLNQVKSLLGKGEAKIETDVVSNQKESETKSTAEEPHSYEWFMSEMKKETGDKSHKNSSEEKPSLAEKSSPKEDEIKYETKEVSSQEDGCKNFISQFKEESKVSGAGGSLVYSELKIDVETESTTKIKTLDQKPSSEPGGKEITPDPERVAQELIHQVASKIAREIVENLDKEALKDLIKKKIEELRS